MSKFWLIVAFFLLANQLPTSRSQNQPSPDPPAQACPAGCSCIAAQPPADAYVSCNLTSTSPNLPTGIPHSPILILNCTDVALTPASQMFASFSFIRSLQVRKCFNQSLVPGTFANLSQLNSLTLQDNQIGSVGPGVFNSTSATSLSLKNNSITTIEEYTFSNAPSVTHIALDDNRIGTLNIIAFNNTNQAVNVTLSGNQLVCDCSLTAIWQRFRSHNPNTICPEGPNVGRTWTELNETLLRQNCPPEPTPINGGATPAGESSFPWLIIGGIAAVLVAVGVCAYLFFPSGSTGSVSKTPDVESGRGRPEEEEVQKLEEPVKCEVPKEVKGEGAKGEPAKIEGAKEEPGKTEPQKAKEKSKESGESDSSVLSIHSKET